LVVADYLEQNPEFRPLSAELLNKLKVCPAEAPIRLDQLIRIQSDPPPGLGSSSGGGGKSYDDWSRIRDGFETLAECLKPDDPVCEVDKVVNFIFKNLPKCSDLKFKRV
jgi:hypothetical protein